MKKLITMIGMGTLLCLVPSCKKSNLMPREASETGTVNNTLQREPGPSLPMDQNSTSMYVMFSSKSCSMPQREFTSLLLDLKGIEVYTDGYGWETLPVITNGWDVVAMQHSDIGLNVTDRIAVRPGIITKIAINFGDNNRLEVNGRPACFKIGNHEVMMDVKGEVRKGYINQLNLNMDICGNIGTQANPDDNSCFILKPVVDFTGITQKKIK